MPSNDGHIPEVKICKFLKGHNCLVSADMDGYLNFYATVPSPYKNQLLSRKIFFNKQEQIQQEAFDTDRKDPVYVPIDG